MPLNEQLMKNPLGLLRPNEKGPHLRFDGNSAGLVNADGTPKVSKAGDTNDAMNYALICGCGAYLSVWGMLKANDHGERSVYCPKCSHATVTDKTGQIKLHCMWDITTNKPL